MVERTSTIGVLATMIGVVLTAAPGCGSGSGNPTPITIDGGGGQPDGKQSDVGVDAPSPDVGTDGGLDGGDRDGGDAKDALSPVSCSSSTPKVEGTVDSKTEVSIDQFVIGQRSQVSTITESILDGTFRVPEPKTSGYGAYWVASKPKDNGKLPYNWQRGGRYVAATKIRAAEETQLYVTPRSVTRLFINGERWYPGDIYSNNDKSVPIRLQKGCNVLSATISVRGGTPKFQLYRTPAEVVFNKRDTTLPHLRVGHETTQPAGIAVLNTSGSVIEDVDAKVASNQYFEATTVEYPSLPADAVTQLAFQLKPKSKWSKAGKKRKAKLQIEAPSLSKTYEVTVKMKTVAPSDRFVRTFRSPVDGSAQYFQVTPPSNYSPMKQYGLAMTMHGAGVGARGTSYYVKRDWLYFILPTNRRPFGFDWEAWGRLNGLAALKTAKEQFNIDPTRVYATGHSMGGHGTWHMGVMHPGKFAAIGPSAGWASFYTYPRPSNPPQATAIRRARAHSETLDYICNLKRRGIYLVHGTKDRNVPIGQAKKLKSKFEKCAKDVDLKYHWEQGADHFWRRKNSDKNSLNWPPLLEFFKNRTLDPNELEFKFTTPGPYYSAEHSYVRVLSPSSPLKDVVLESSKVSDKKIELKTTNVRAMEIDGKALADKGIETIAVDGTDKQVKSKTMTIGPTSGKGPGQHSTLNEVFRDQFCFVYEKDGPDAYVNYISYLTSNWSIRGNGYACAVPLSSVDQELRDNWNLVYVGTPFDAIPNHGNRPFSWSDNEVGVGGNTYQKAAGFILFPSGDSVSAAFVATKGQEELLFRHMPFTSRNGMPDYLLVGRRAGQYTGLGFGFFDAEWKFDPSLGRLAQ
ncbi:MAG: prolyl oligopeptidase family serine peptidase [Bradymonadaceae bacterium]